MNTQTHVQTTIRTKSKIYSLFTVRLRFVSAGPTRTLSLYPRRVLQIVIIFYFLFFSTSMTAQMNRLLCESLMTFAACSLTVTYIRPIADSSNRPYLDWIFAYLSNWFCLGVTPMGDGVDFVAARASEDVFNLTNIINMCATNIFDDGSSSSEILISFARNWNIKC